MDQSTTSRQPGLIFILLALVLIVGAGLRLFNPLWDQGTFPHPDERSTLLFYATQIRWPDEGVDILDPRQSTLNPFWDVRGQSRRSYTYGHFPLYSLVLSSAFLQDLAPLATQLNAPPGLIDFLNRTTTGQGYALVGRMMVALLDTLSIYLVFLIGRRLYGPWIGLLAAALSAFAVLHIQLAHFFAVDPISTTFVLLAIYGSTLILDRRSVGAAILTGVAIGLAVSSKYSALPIILAPATAGFFIWQDKESLDKSGLSAAARPVVIAAIVSFITFALTSPFVLLDFENFRQAVVTEQGAMVSGAADFPFTRQYRKTTPYLYFIQQQIEWGLGWTLGLLAFGGFAWAIVRAFGGRLRRGEWIVLSWLVPYFAINGLFLAKFMRYMSPVTPLVIVFGAGTLAVFARQFEGRWPAARRVAVSVAVVVLLGTVMWAAMFVNGVYATEHSWVTTSRWIYEHVPDGSCIAREHWEEGVPRDWAWLEPGMSPGQHGYNQPELPMYEPDTQQKYERIRDTLRNCDYLVIASNRMMRTLPRLSERYPMSTAYYQALFDGRLGYRLVYQHETPPRLGPLVIDDQPADESFTVYDHPKAFVFQKVRDLSDAEWFAVFGNTWNGALHGYVGQPTLLMRLRGETNVPALTPNQQSEAEGETWLQKPLHEWPVVDDWRWNSAANQSPVLAAFIWWLAVQLIGLAALPVTFALFARLVDRGYLLSKSLGLLLISYMTWLLASVGLPANQLAVIVGGLILLAVVGVFLAWRQWADIGRWWRSQWKLVLLGEGIFLAVYVLFTVFRAANPDLWQPWRGGEKMLEIGFLNAIVKSAYMPPYDPFFAGTYLNYYYYGLYIAGILSKLTGIQPVIAFNLAVPALAALTAINVFSLAANLARRKMEVPSWRGVVAGLLAVLFVLFFSNLDGMGLFLRNLAEISDSQFSSAVPGLETLVRAGNGFVKALAGVPVKEYDFWEPSRVIPATINEFPYWSFLFADLHPHMIGIPFTVLFLALVYAWLRGSGGVGEWGSGGVGEQGSRGVGEQGSRGAEGQESRGVGGQGLVGPGTFAVEIDMPSGKPVEQTVTAETGPVSFWAELREILAQEWVDLAERLTGGTFWRWLALPFVLGALVVINAWDLPTYVGIMCAGFALSRYRAGLRPLTLARGLVLLGETAGFAALLLGGTLLFYRPFFASYRPLVSGLGTVRDKIPLDQFFKLWGFFLFIIVTWLIWQLRRPNTRFASLRAISLFIRRWNVFPHLIEIYGVLIKKSAPGYRLALALVGLVLLAGLAFLALEYVVVALLIPFALIAFLLLLRWEVSPEQSFVELLVFTSLMILLGVQFVYLKDWLGGGDHYRMNTYFKFFVQVWVMFGLAAGVMLPTLWGVVDRWSVIGRWLWQMTTVILVFSSLVFFVLGTRQRNDYRFPGARPAEATLDGMAYMTVGQFTWENVVYEMRYDYDAIRWLQENVQGTPIVAEAKIGYYREAGMRVAAYTGLPSILGGLHQNEQHPADQVGRRDGLVQQFWNEVAPARFMELARQLEVDYIYFGQLERNLYGDHHQQKFDQLVQQGQLALVYANEKTRIYRVVALQ